jgi:hypothetical protein
MIRRILIFQFIIYLLLGVHLNFNCILKVGVEESIVNAPVVLVNTKSEVRYFGDTFK